jgi:hypothetical protein
MRTGYVVLGYKEELSDNFTLHKTVEKAAKEIQNGDKGYIVQFTLVKKVEVPKVALTLLDPDEEDSLFDNDDDEDTDNEW